MIFSLMDYYLIFFIFFIVMVLMLTPLNYFNYSILNSKTNKYLVFRLNMTSIILKNVKMAMMFVLIFFMLGCSFNYEIDVMNSEMMLKNFFILSKMLFFFFLLIFLMIFEYYLKMIKWFNPDVMMLFYMSIVSLYLILQVENLFNFYLILEMYSLSMLSCMSLKKTKFKTNIESLLKYFFMNAMSSCFVLFGISMIYANSGLNNFLDLKFFLWQADNHPNFFYINVGIFFFMIGLFMKLSSFPFNYWFMDIYNNISMMFTVFLLIFPKFMLSCFLFMFYISVANNNMVANNLLLYLSLFTIFTNIMISFYQTSMKKLMMVTSFSNLPFFIMFIYFKSFNSMVAFFSFSLMYYMNLFSVFIFLFLFVNKKSKNGIFFKKIVSLSNLFKINKSLAYMLSLSLLSLAGLPLLSGFFGKFYFLTTLMTTNNIFFFLFFSLMNLLLMFVYLSLVKLIFQNKNIYFYKFMNLNSKLLVCLFVISFIFNITFVLYFDFLYNFIKFFLLAAEWIYVL